MSSTGYYKEAAEGIPRRATSKEAAHILYDLEALDQAFRKFDFRYTPSLDGRAVNNPDDASDGDYP